MTRSDTALRPAPPSRRRDPPVAALVATVAAAVRLLPVLAGGGLRGAGGYDDGVYFTAATALVHGRMPYAAFVLLHPPGIALVLAPFAALTRWVPDSVAFALARVAFVALGTLTAVLVARLGSLAGGRAAALTAGLAYAVAPAAAYAERTTMLEGPANLCLAAALVVLLARPVLTARPALAAGALLGLGTGVKIWGVVPLAVVAGWVGARAGPRRLGELLTGAAAALTALCLPFFLAAPDQMTRYVVLAQLGRVRMAVGWTERLAGVVGPALGPAAAPTPAEVALVAGGCAAVALA
ncbi:glycosyltransferase 87 family protein, partial [Georgenia thermotolerans]